MRLFLFLMLCGMLSVQAAFAQPISISGTITDIGGDLLPGVNVTVLGTTTGVVSDANGKYSISVPAGDAVLQFTFVGFATQEIAVEGRRSIDVTMSEEAEKIEEVVVVGYGTMKKSDLTGSVGSVNSEEIVKKGTTSVMDALQGAIAGVDITMTSSRPGSGFSIQIRGQNSMETGSPLYVVDGIVTDDIDFLNPSDIDKIDVLKDASSTAIYGSRGSNGVVIVQTKNAEFGKQARVTVSYDGYYGIREVARIPDLMDGRTYLEYRTTAYHSWDAANGKWRLTDVNTPEAGKLKDKESITLLSPIVHEMAYDENYTDWLGLVMQTGQQQNHYLNVSGNAKEMSYNIGLGYQHEKGNFIQEEFDRYNLKVSVNHTPSKFFRSGATANLSFNTFDQGSQNGYRDAIQLATIIPAFDADGKVVPQPGTGSALNGKVSNNFTSSANPLIEVNAGSQETRRFDIMGNVYMQVTPLPGLDIKTSLSPRLNRNRRGIYRGVALGNRTKAQEYASTSNMERFEYTWDNQITYDKRFGNHKLNATFINSLYYTRFESIVVAAQDFPYPSAWYNIYSGTLVPGDCSSEFSETSLLSFAGRVNYDYKGKYMLTGTIRYDGSSKLAEKWAAFPSAAVAWRLSEEEFMKSAEWLSNLKARLSLGYSGNNNGVRAYGTMDKPQTGDNVYYDFYGVSSSGFAPGVPVNRLLTWERTREVNFGLDFGLFNSRVNGTVELYDKLSDGLLMSRRLAVESGVNSMTDNVGSVNNRGVEVALNTVNIRTKDLYWSTSFTFSHNKNAIRSVYGKKEDVIGEAYFIGEPINILYDYRLLGVWKQADYDAGKTVYRRPDGTVQYTAKPGEAITDDANHDGVLSTEDKVVLGTPDPKWTGSMSSTLQYKNWDFSFSIITRQGMLVNDVFTARFGPIGNRGLNAMNYDFYIPVGAQMPDWSTRQTDADGNVIMSWKTHEGNEDTQYPIYDNAKGGYYGSSLYHQNTSFVKVRNITLGYNFGKISKVGISRLRVYVNVLNPFVFTKYPGWDPEFAGTGWSDGNGPSNITYQFGVNVKF
ncbi:MAG: TonB-dependent receptor [Bacteroidales bacterium]|nr:TonB-dependent receptor [Bacteroidales bacterium]